MSEQIEAGLQEQVDRIIRRLDREYLQIQDPNDRALLTLAHLGRTGVGVGVAIVADGVLYTGAIGSDNPVFDAAAIATREALRANPERDDEDVEAIAAVFADTQAFLERLWRDDDRVAAKYRDLSGGIDDIDLQDILPYYRWVAEEGFIDMRDANVHFGNRDPIAVTSVRITLQHVSAWWTLKSQGVDVNYIFAESPKK